MKRNFEDLACEVLDLCHKSSEEKLEKLLMVKVPEFGYSTSLQIGVLSNSLDFMSHISCQNLLTKLWFNRINVDNSRMAIYFCSIFPIFAPFMIDFGSRVKEKYRVYIIKIIDFLINN